MQFLKKGFTLIELIIVILIIAVFVVIGVPMFDRYSVRNDVVTKTEETMIMLDTAQTMSANPEQGYTAYKVTRESDDSLTLGKTIDEEKCDINNVNFEIMEETNTYNFVLTELETDNYFCFDTSGGKYFYDGDSLLSVLPDEIEVSSLKFNNMNIGTPPSISILEQDAADIGYKVIFELNE